LPGASLQLIVNNLFDRSYDDPGRDAEIIGAPLVPQPGRTVYFKLIYAPGGLNGREKGAATPERAAIP
jgi:hypothetical protein